MVLSTCEWIFLRVIPPNLLKFENNPSNNVRGFLKIVIFKWWERPCFFVGKQSGWLHPGILGLMQK